MATVLTAESFARLLAYLDSDRDRAGEKYEDLRRTLIKFFEWRGAPFPEDHADDSLNRVARRLAKGTEIKNVNAYCHEVARLVCLEVWKGRDNRRAPLEANHEDIASTNTADEADDREVLLRCLDECLDRLPTESRGLIVEYYGDSRDQIARRKALAATLGVRREALANRAQRLRNKLEQCVTRCSSQKPAIRMS